jgi:hypothetical protein
MPHKGNMGFSTPSGDLQHALRKLRDELGRSRGNWEEAEIVIGEMADMIVGVLEDHPLTPETATPADAAALFSLAAVGYITKAGRQLSEMHERLVKVETSLADLKRVLVR